VLVGDEAAKVASQRGVYRRKDVRGSERGPFWYFRYHEGGKQRKLYPGRTDDPEGALKKKRVEKATSCSPPHSSVSPYGF
jgi:hypothetical protein